jgi:hypothetical protein
MFKRKMIYLLLSQALACGTEMFFALSGWQAFEKTFDRPSVTVCTHCFFSLVRRLFGVGHPARSKKQCFSQNLPAGKG